MLLLSHLITADPKSDKQYVVVLCGLSRLSSLSKFIILFYVQVTAHRDNLRINNQQDTTSIQNFFVTKLYMFRAPSVPIIRSYVTIGMFHAGYVAAASAVATQPA